MSAHTPEPWFAWKNSAYWDIKTDDVEWSGTIGSVWEIDEDQEVQESNARRIVECVNACSGMDDPKAWIASVEKQRDKARVMVKELVSEIRTLLEPMNELLTHADGPEADRVFPQYEFDALRTLIVKAEALS